MSTDRSRTICVTRPPVSRSLEGSVAADSAAEKSDQTANKIRTARELFISCAGKTCHACQAVSLKKLPVTFYTLSIISLHLTYYWGVRGVRAD